MRVAKKKGGHGAHLSKNRDSIGQEYGLSGSSVARLLRVNQLIPEIKEMLDGGKMQLMAAVQLSYLKKKEQEKMLEARDFAQCTPSLSQAGLQSSSTKKRTLLLRALRKQISQTTILM